MIKIGIDIVDLARFAREFARPEFQQRVYLRSEFTEELERAAANFAAKEAVLKALSLPVGSWQQIRIYRESSGKPLVEVDNFSGEIEISISHTDTTVIAVAIATLE